MLTSIQGHDRKWCRCNIENCEKCSIEYVDHLSDAEKGKRMYITCCCITNDKKPFLNFTNWNNSCGQWKDFKSYRLSPDDDIWVFIPGEEESLKHSVNNEATLFFKTHFPEVEADGIRGPAYVIRKQDVESDSGTYFSFKHLDRVGTEQVDVEWLLK
jgi:hypothetical protein